MRIGFFINGLILTLVSSAATAAPTNPCKDSVGWRQQLCMFAKTHFKHAAWGYEHSLRDYALAVSLASTAEISFDDDVLFAAAMLHDMGGFSPYVLPNVDHAVRSTQVIDPVLAEAGFPMEKSSAVKSAIRAHSYYETVAPTTNEGILLHDADANDFLGNISAMRILGIVGHEPSIPTVKKALAVLESLYKDAPAHIYSGEKTKKFTFERANELRFFLDSVSKESYGFGVP